MILLFLVATRIVGLANIFRFGTVCRYWRLIVEEVATCIRLQWSTMGHASLLLKILMIFASFTIFSQAKYRILSSPSTGSAHGWLVSDNGGGGHENPSFESSLHWSSNSSSTTSFVSNVSQVVSIRRCYLKWSARWIHNQGHFVIKPSHRRLHCHGRTSGPQILIFS